MVLPIQRRGQDCCWLCLADCLISGLIMQIALFRRSVFALLIAGSCFAATPEPFSDTHKPVLHGRHWVAITGKPLGATAGAMMLQRGGNAVDAACAMLAAVCTMYD